MDIPVEVLNARIKQNVVVLVARKRGTAPLSVRSRIGRSTSSTATPRAVFALRIILHALAAKTS